MAEGRSWSIRVYIPADPLDANDGVTVMIVGLGSSRTRTFLDATKTREQLLTTALTAARAYILSRDPPPV